MSTKGKIFGVIVLGLLAIGLASYLLFPAKPVVLGFELSEDEIQAARKLLLNYPAIDVHAHPGRTFVKDAENLNWKLGLYKLQGTFEQDTIADMVDGGLSSSVFNGVADFQLLSVTDQGLAATREYEPGEAWDSFQTQLTNINALQAYPQLEIAKTPTDILLSHARSRSASHATAILAMEGADFLDEDITRVQAAYDAGVRMLTLMHYHNNSLGDIMTDSHLERGLTAFGKEVVQEMNRLGMMIDLAHASERTAIEAINASTKSVILSHTHFNTPALSHPRFISKKLALAVAKTGGVIGAWPAGIGIETLAEFIDRIEALIDLVGEDHVVLGSDMDANYKPVFDNYRKLPWVVGALSQRGYSDLTIAKFIGGNFLRVMSAVQNK